MQSILDPEVQNKTFQWSKENLSAEMPILPGKSAGLIVSVHAAADFLAPIADGKIFIHLK